MEKSTKQSKNIEESLHGTIADIDEVNKLVKQPYQKVNINRKIIKKHINTRILKRKHAHDVEKKDTYHITVNVRKVKSA